MGLNHNFRARFAAKTSSTTTPTTTTAITTTTTTTITTTTTTITITITKSPVVVSVAAAAAAAAAAVSTTASRQHLRSAAGHQLVIPSHRFTTYHGRRAFSVAGPMFWNSLPRNLRDPSHTAAAFGRSLKTFLFSVLVYTVHPRHLR